MIWKPWRHSHDSALAQDVQNSEGVDQLGTFGVVALGPAGLAQDEDNIKITKSLHRKHTTCRHLA